MTRSEAIEVTVKVANILRAHSGEARHEPLVQGTEEREGTKPIRGMDILVFGDGVHQDVQPIGNAIRVAFNTIKTFLEGSPQSFQGIQFEELEHLVNNFISSRGLALLHAHPRVKQGVKRQVHPGVGAIKVRIKTEGLQSM